MSLSLPSPILIAAIDRRLGLGKNNALAWKLPADMAHFRAHTLDHTVIMGRKTFESIGRPLPKRRNIVVSANPLLTIEGCEVAQSLEIALALSDDRTPYVIGGAQIYRLALPLSNHLVLTHVDTDIDADAFFPSWRAEEWTTSFLEKRPADDANSLDLVFQEYRRVSPSPHTLSL